MKSTIAATVLGLAAMAVALPQYSSDDGYTSTATAACSSSSSSYYTSYTSVGGPYHPTGGYPYPTGGAPPYTTGGAPPYSTGGAPYPTGGAPPAPYPTGDATCPVNGALVCNGPNYFGLCNWGHVIWQPVALGTACENGEIVGIGIYASDYTPPALPTAQPTYSTYAA